MFVALIIACLIVVLIWSLYYAAKHYNYPKCSADNNCHMGEICKDGKCLSVTGTDCQNNSECPDDHVCYYGSCVKPTTEGQAISFTTPNASQVQNFKCSAPGETLYFDDLMVKFLDEDGEPQQDIRGIANADSLSTTRLVGSNNQVAISWGTNPSYHNQFTGHASCLSIPSNMIIESLKIDIPS